MAPSSAPAADGDADAAEMKRLERDIACAEYFGTLPVVGLSEEEEDLRTAIQNAINETGSVRLSIAAQREEVRQAKQRMNMPQGVGLTQWLSQRVSDEFALVSDANSGEKILCLAGAEHEVGIGGDIEGFYASLPENGFTKAESVLREQVLLAMRKLNGRCRVSQLTRGTNARELQQARSAVLPKGAPMMGWLERRLAAEVAFEPGQGAGHVAVLTPVGRAAAAAFAKGMLQPQLRPQPPSAPPPLREPKGCGRGRPAEDEDQTDAERQAEREQAKLEKEARILEFFDGLPGESLTLEEQNLREALFVSMERKVGHGSNVRLSTVCQEDDVRQAKASLLPPEVTVACWIEARIGGEIILSKDPGGQVLCEPAPGFQPPVAARKGGRGQVQQQPRQHVQQPAQQQPEVAQISKEEKDALMAEYFEGRPLSSMEELLKSILLEAVARKGGEPNRLSDLLNNDPQMQSVWKSLKVTWLALSPPLVVSFAPWVELRMAKEVRVTREPYVQFSRQEQERRGLSKKRSAPEAARAPAHLQRQAPYHPQQPPAKIVRLNGPPPIVRLNGPAPASIRSTLGQR